MSEVRLIGIIANIAGNNYFIAISVQSLLTTMHTNPLPIRYVKVRRFALMDTDSLLSSSLICIVELREERICT